MLQSLKSGLNTMLVSFYKNMTLGLFFILPAKVSSIFVSLSILVLIYDLKSIDFVNRQINEEKFNALLKISFHEDVLLLPSYTMHWFWKKELLQTEVQLGDKVLTLQEAIMDNSILFRYPRFITNVLLQNLPRSMRYKLKIKETKEQLEIKHNVMKLLMYS